MRFQFQRNLVLFSVSVVALILLSGGCHLLSVKTTEKEGISKKDVVSVNRTFQFSKLVPLTSQSRKIPSFQFQRIEKGSFIMGSPKVEKGRWKNEKQKLVKISKSFEIMVTEVTQEQWVLVMGNNPSRFKKARYCPDHELIKIQGRDIEMCPKHPVERVSWNSVQRYIQKLNAFLGLRGCNGTPHETRGCYRLSTEAEWEYAVRAGTKKAYFFGNDSSVLRKYAWYKKNSGGKTHEVRTRAPNPWGLYDVYGNVWEWMQDGYIRELPGGKDPLVNFWPLRLAFRVARGGGWNVNARYLRSGNRDYDFPLSNWDDDLGFRLVRTL